MPLFGIYTAPLCTLEVVRLREPSDIDATCVSFAKLKAVNAEEPEWLSFLFANSGGNEVNCCKPSRSVTEAVCVAIKVTSVSTSNDIRENETSELCLNPGGGVLNSGRTRYYIELANMPWSNIM